MPNRGWRLGAWQGGVALLAVALVPAVYAAPDAMTESAVGAVQSSSIEISTPFAMVGEESVSREEFQAALHEGMRRRFFHGAPQPEQLTAYRLEVTQRLVDRVLLRQEIRRRGIVANTVAVDAKLAQIEQRLSGTSEWRADRERALPLLRGRLEDEDKLAQLEAQVKQVPVPGMAEVRQYYQDHLDQFTTPERVRVSLILLKVAPSASAQMWKVAEQEAAQLVGKLRNGADFAELARLHSADSSAARGGDLGYVHHGMLAAEAQQVLDKMVAGDISDPVMLLQGVVVLRLGERAAAVLNDAVAAEPRARELLMREQADAAWQGLIEGLRARTPVVIKDNDNN